MDWATERKRMIETKKYEYRAFGIDPNTLLGSGSKKRDDISSFRKRASLRAYWRRMKIS